MAVSRITLTEDERRVANAERDYHPEAHTRRKMLVVWLLHSGLTRAKAAAVAGPNRPTVQRYVAAVRTGGLRRWGIRGPSSVPTPSASRGSADPRGRRPKRRSESNAGPD
jgi:hypothetical protein